MKKLSFLFITAVAILASCTPESNNPAPKTVTFDGSTHEFDVSYASNNNINAQPGDIKIVYANLLVTDISTPYPMLSVGYGVNTFADASDENINTFCTTGSKTFQTIGNNSGVVVNIMPSASSTYSSMGGSQTGSTFSFTAFTYHSGSPDYVDYSADFSCKMYNVSDTTQMKPISGSVSGRFVANY
jgi:hypothetical protein